MYSSPCGTVFAFNSNSPWGYLNEPLKEPLNFDSSVIFEVLCVTTHHAK